MKNNKLTIQINKPVSEVFTFTITPPNSTLWIKSIVDEETNEWPVRAGTIYKLKNKAGQYSEVIVAFIKENTITEWVSMDGTYHCRYTYKSINENTMELEYYEWVDIGEIDEPFTQDILEKLKSVIEDPETCYP